MINVLLFILSLLPLILIFLFLKNRKKEDKDYQILCVKGLKLGLLQCVGFVVLTAGFLYIVYIILKHIGVNAIIRNIYFNYIVLALSEEMVKYTLLKNLFKKNNYSYTWLDIMSLMAIIGIGFGFSESFLYVFGVNAGIIITRRVSATHCSYGLLMGYLLAKSKYTNKKSYNVLAIIIPFILHGTYDLCLSKTMKDLNENIGTIAIVLAIVTIIINIAMIMFINKNKSVEKYNTALLEQKDATV